MSVNLFPDIFNLLCVQSYGQYYLSFIDGDYTMIKNNIQGREVEIGKIKKYLMANPGKPSEPLVLHGEAGCGKTSLLAKVFSSVSSSHSPHQNTGLRCNKIFTLVGKQ